MWNVVTGFAFTDMGSVSYPFLDMHIPHTLYDHKTDTFLALEWGNLYIAACNVKLHALYHYDSRLHGTEEESFCLSKKGLNTNLQVLTVHITFLESPLMIFQIM